MSIDRYNVEAVANGGDLFTDSHKSSDGQWVRYEDHVAALRAERAKVLAKFAAFAGPDGEPRKVLGTLPLTADGAVVGISDPREDETVFIRRDDLRPGLVVGMRGEVWLGNWRNLRSCYSTRAAAEAARKENP